MGVDEACHHQMRAVIRDWRIGGFGQYTVEGTTVLNDAIADQQTGIFKIGVGLGIRAILRRAVKGQQATAKQFLGHRFLKSREEFRGAATCRPSFGYA